MKKIYFVRHGMTIANDNQILSGWYNHQLNETGLKQIEEAKKKFMNKKYKQIEKIYSSDLDRAFCTAKKINEALNLEIEKCKELREINFGNYENFPYEKRNEVYDYNEFIKKPFNLKYEGGESIFEACQRFCNKVDEIIKNHNEVLIVAHGMVINLAINYYLFANPLLYPQFFIDNAKISLLKIEDNGLKKLLYLNR